MLANNKNGIYDKYVGEFSLWRGKKSRNLSFDEYMVLKSESWYQIISSQSLARLRNTEKDRIWKNSD